MSPENDQCRWVGIRPVNPPEDIPVTLDAEVVHVIVDSGGGGLAPGAPLLVDLYQAASIKDQWYTILNIVTGSGHIQKIHMGANTSVHSVQIGVTVDGGARVTYQPTVQTKLVWQDLANASDMYKEVPIYLIRYETSVKVEIRQVLINGKNLYGLCSYLPD